MSNLQPLAPERAVAICLNAGILQVTLDGTSYELTERYRHDETRSPEAGGLYQHQDGGIYRYLHSAKSSEDQAELYIYEHLWPFDAGQVWARPAHEWGSRFTRIRSVDLILAKTQAQDDAQQAVKDAKAARRAANKS